ncbi:hypothetical protein BJ165DRAFT_1402238 [Panaeolus papilionaceus]|nr:hypothetical protein BJ165DRAFT_1402238 [Panaeolus papilionaceus]
MNGAYLNMVEVVRVDGCLTRSQLPAVNEKGGLSAGVKFSGRGGGEFVHRSESEAESSSLGSACVPEFLPIKARKSAEIADLRILGGQGMGLALSGFSALGRIVTFTLYRLIDELAGGYSLLGVCQSSNHSDHSTSLHRHYYHPLSETPNFSLKF